MDPRFPLGDRAAPAPLAPAPAPLAPAPAPLAPARRWLHAYAVLLASATLVLILAGALVTSTESGLAVPDWPLSYGSVFPAMTGGVFYEHGHRLIAATVGLLTLGFAISARVVEPRVWVQRLAAAALMAVVLQGVLGGVTVIYKLPLVISVSHGILAQLFFSTTVVLATVTSPAFLASRPAPATGLYRRLAPLAAAAVLVQLVFGAVMRHMDAGLSIPDFPLMHGALIPDFRVYGAAIHFFHRVWAVPAAALVVAAAVAALRRPERPAALTGAARGALALVPVQIALGATTVLTLRAVTPTSLHVATGALILGLTVLLATWSFRVAGGSGAAVASPGPLEVAGGAADGVAGAPPARAAARREVAVSGAGL